MLVRLCVFLLLLFVTATPAGAEGLEEVAAEAEHMVGDVAKAKTAQPAEARALAKEIADHAAEAEEALEAAGGGAPASARPAIETAVAGAGRVAAAGQAVQRAGDADVPARVGELETAVQAFVPQLRAAVAAARPAGLPRSGGFPAPETLAAAAVAGLALFAGGRWLILRATT